MRTLRVRTLTLGVMADSLEALLHGADVALALLERGRAEFAAAGYEVQTLRIATAPLLANLDHRQRAQALPALLELDAHVRHAGVMVSIGPVLRHGVAESDCSVWIADLLQSTTQISTSIEIANTAGVHARACDVAAATIRRLALALPQGLANFCFAAAANIPAGTPFFPVAWHDGATSIAVGLESAGLVEQAMTGATCDDEAQERLRAELNGQLGAIETIAMNWAHAEHCVYRGIDASPAPGMDRSIGAAIEAFTKSPFGVSGTLQACSVITHALKNLAVRTCGYSGLMLPVLEDPVLAQRAIEGRYGLRDLLLFSSVCGTGLDVAPIPDDASAAEIAALLRDVGALSCRLNKPLSARLFIIPGKQAGDRVAFDDPLLTQSTVFALA